MTDSLLADGLPADEPPVPTPTPAPVPAPPECDPELGERAAEEFSHRFQTINIWGNRGFLNISDLVSGGQHADFAGDGEPAPARGDGVEPREGDIPAERTALALEGFAEPGWFADALGRLRDDRLLFLAGEEGTGRRTAALNLLHRQTGSFDLRALDSDTDLTTWAPTAAPARGYLADGLLEPRLTALDTIALDGLRARLERADARMVVVVPRTPAALAHLGDTLHTPPVRAVPPEPRAVLDARLAAVLGGPADVAPALAALPPGLLDDILLPGLRPAQVVEIAAEIVRVVRRGADPESVREHLSFHAADRAPRLLDTLRDRPEDLALLLAACVFEHFDQTLVEEEAERLLRIADGRLGGTAPEEDADAEEPPPPVFRRSRSERLAAIGAYAAPAEVRTTSAYSYLTQPVVFTRHLQGRAVLEHVWREHPAAASLLVEWLGSTPSEHGRGDRAGFVLGQCAQWSSGRRALGPVEELAASARPADWRLAARALGAASTDPVLATAVKARLRGWSRQGSVSRRCTAALACATEFGLARPGTALTLLRTVCDGPGDGTGAVASAVRRALLSLFAEPAGRDALLTGLVPWCRAGGATRQAACTATAHLLRTAATAREPAEWWTRHLLGTWTGGAPGEDPPGLELIRCALAEPETFPAVRAALLDWQRRAADDPRRAPFVEHLADRLGAAPRGGVLRLLTAFEAARPAPGGRRAGEALAAWRQAL
ncbi:hypothetical protein [Streptomyces huiliensis]|uniref:hypothetical protein n=1 Tax=Streptomyces huiliensis TaxID=2876027 RepID=UPI001CBB0983|nr:hypothetical protein [Streptomyces huiliensis]MBZ4323607.1 hypothetical protein [Streptomyces huiliensis]